jgi:hypothetical protein
MAFFHCWPSELAIDAPSGAGILMKAKVMLCGIYTAPKESACTPEIIGTIT